ncbi:MAG: hypothetical protein R2757_03470 [Draconibacterium sp.]
MKTVNLILLLLAHSLFSWAQGLSTFNPIIEEMPSPPPRINFDYYNFNEYERTESNKASMNRGYYEAILELQSTLLQIMEQSNDKNFNTLALKHYNILGSFKKKGDILYLYTEELITARNRMEREFKEYFENKNSTTFSANETAFSSTVRVNNIWSNLHSEYVTMSTENIKSQFYLTDNTISFKIGGADWTICNWEYVGYNKENKFVMFEDDEGQLYYLTNYKPTLLMIFSDKSGETYKNFKVFDKIVMDPNISPPWINDPRFQKMK